MMSKRKKSRQNTIIIYNFRLKDKVFAFFLILVIIVFLYIKFLATPLVIKNTKTQISAYAVKSINLAVADTMNQNINYSDLVTVVKMDNGEISELQANSVKINLLSKTMTKIVLGNFLEFSKKPISINLGAFSGISVLTGVGSPIEFDVKPYGEVLSAFRSEFVSAGINQTYHKLYLILSIKVNAVLPLQVVSVENSSEVLLCETLIVGKIPEVYLQSGSLTEMLNLVPEKFSSWQIWFNVS